MKFVECERQRALTDNAVIQYLVQRGLEAAKVSRSSRVCLITVAAGICDLHWLVQIRSKALPLHYGQVVDAQVDVLIRSTCHK